MQLTRTKHYERAFFKKKVIFNRLFFLLTKLNIKKLVRIVDDIDAFK